MGQRKRHPPEQSHGLGRWGQKWGHSPSLRLWGVVEGGTAGNTGSCFGRQAGTKGQGQQLTPGSIGKEGLREFLGKNRSLQEQKTPHLNFTRAHISVPVPSSPKSTGVSRAAEIGLSCHGKAGKSAKQQVCAPRPAVWQPRAGMPR